MNMDNKTFVIEAANRFYASYKDSFGFLLLMYLSKNHMLHIIENAPDDIENEIERLYIDSNTKSLDSSFVQYRNSGVSSISICFDVQKEECAKEAVEILLSDIIECEKYYDIEPIVLCDVASLLIQVDYDEFDDDEFWDLYDDQSMRIQQGKRGDKKHVESSSIQPKEVVSFISKIAKYDDHCGFVFSPTAQTCASFVKNRIPDGLFYGYEGQKNYWAVGVLRLVSKGFSPENIEKKSVIKDWPRIKPSLIFAMPRIGSFVDVSKYDYEPPCYESIEKYILLKAFDYLEPKGELIMECNIEMLKGFCDREDKIRGFGSFFDFDDAYDEYAYAFDLRKKRDILEYLDMVILLPKRLYNYKNYHYSRAILVFCKDRPQDKLITMVDGSTYYDETSTVNVLRCDDLYNAIENENLSTVCSVKYSDIEKNGFDLNPTIYINSISELPEGRKKQIRDLVDVYEGVKSNGINGLVVNVASRTVDGKIYPYELKNGVPDRIINKECLLLQRSGNMRPSYYVPYCNDQIIGINRDTCAFFIHNDVNLDYLLAELNKPYVKQQYAAKLKGSSNQYISVQDILKIVVVVPETIEEQLKSYKEDVELRITENSSRYVAELENEYKQKYENFKKEMRLRKHALSQKLNHLLPGFSVLISTMEKQKGWLNSEMIISPTTNDTVRARFDKLKKYLEEIQELVQLLLDDTEYDEPSPEWIEPIIQEYIDNAVHDIFEFDTEFEQEQVRDGYGNSNIIHHQICISRRLLLTIFENIVGNAVKHGFADASRKNNIIRFATETKIVNGTSMLSIKIANNGCPLASGMTEEKVFQWGETTSGTGLGGYQIKEITEHYKGSVKINQYKNPIDGFYVEYELMFPITNIKNEDDV